MELLRAGGFYHLRIGIGAMDWMNWRDIVFMIIIVLSEVLRND